MKDDIYNTNSMSSLGVYHKMNKKFIPMLEEFIIYREIEYCASLKSKKISNQTIVDLKEIILDFYNEDNVMNFPLHYSARFITNNYLDRKISLKELRDGSFNEIYSAIENNDIGVLKKFDFISEKKNQRWER